MTHSEIIFQKIDNMIDLPELPLIASEVNKMLQDGETAIDKLGEALEKDRNIGPKVMELVNSNFFGFQSDFTDISRAIVVLGFYTIRNLVISLSVLDSFSGRNSSDSIDLVEYWTHSIGVAMTSKYLSQRMQYQFPEEAFTGGLLHDIGKIVFIRYLPELFKKVWTSAERKGLTFYESEKIQIPLTHAEIGGHLASRWQLPKDIVEVILFHHSVETPVIKPTLLIIIHVADALVNGLMNKTNGKINLSTIDKTALELMKPHLDTAQNWFPELESKIDAACRFFLEWVKR